jgi:hypothetical protein
MKPHIALVLLAALVALLALVLPGCSDPNHAAEVNALGPEAPGVSPGPTHRPGQPCLTCHGGDGPGGQTFVTAGTIYVNQYMAGTTDYAPVVNGTVHLVDANGSTFDSQTNTVGNFFVTTDQWNPTFPLGEKSTDAGMPPPSGCLGVGLPIEYSAGQINVGGTPDGGCQSFPTPMMSAIERGGVYASCAYCHFDPPGPTSPGHVFLN